jgi:hypothetical protein
MPVLTEDEAVNREEAKRSGLLDWQQGQYPDVPNFGVPVFDWQVTQ